MCVYSCHGLFLWPISRESRLEVNINRRLTTGLQTAAFWDSRIVFELQTRDVFGCFKCLALGERSSLGFFFLQNIYLYCMFFFFPTTFQRWSSVTCHLFFFFFCRHRSPAHVMGVLNMNIYYGKYHNWKYFFLFYISLVLFPMGKVYQTRMLHCGIPAGFIGLMAVHKCSSLFVCYCYIIDVRFKNAAFCVWKYYIELI